MKLYLVLFWKSCITHSIPKFEIEKRMLCSIIIEEVETMYEHIKFYIIGEWVDLTNNQ